MPIIGLQIQKSNRKIGKKFYFNKNIFQIEYAKHFTNIDT